MTTTVEELDDTLSVVIDNTAETIANLIGLPCPNDPGNRLRLLALIRAAANRAITSTVIDAERHDYTPSEIAALLARPQEF